MGQDWQADWIGSTHDLPAEQERPGPMPVAFLAKPFQVDSAITRATLRATAMGCVLPLLNGAPVAKSRLDPGWTDYRRRAYYREWDVSGQLTEGVNTLGLLLAPGWYAGYIGPDLKRFLYGSKPRAMIELLYETDSGQAFLVCSDETWQDIPIDFSSDLYMGDRWGGTAPYRTEPEQVVVGADFDPQVLPHPGPSVIEGGPTKPVSFLRLDEARWLLDFGTYLTGRIANETQDLIEVRYCEALEGGLPYYANLRTAQNMDRLPAESNLQAHFAHRGFRYAEVRGTATEPQVKAVPLIAEMAERPDPPNLQPDLKRILDAVRMTIRSAWLDIPMDCPQRDERLGWTGDVNVVAQSALRLFECESLLRKWLVDLFDAQFEDGGLPPVAPHVVVDLEGGPGWSDAAVHVPLAIYKSDGDSSHLHRHFGSIRKWVDFQWNRCSPGPYPPEEFHCFGDWLNVDQETPHGVLFMICLARSLGEFAEICQVVDRQDLAHEQNQRLDQVRQSFSSKYLDAQGRVQGDSQAGQAMALRSGILQGDNIHRAQQHLIAHVERDGMRTGFLGTRDLLFALSGAGRNDLALKLATNPDVPGWLHMIEHGPGTIWERWDGWTEERGFADPAMNSFCHTAFGSVAAWICELGSQ